MELTTKELLLMFGLILESEFLTNLNLLTEEDGELFLQLQAKIHEIDESTTPEELAEKTNEQLESAINLIDVVKKELSKSLLNDLEKGQ